MSKHKIEKLPNEILSSAELYQVINELGGLVDAKPSAKTKASSSNPQPLSQLPQAVSYFFRKPPTLAQIADLKSQLEHIIQTSPAVRLTLSDFPDTFFCRKLADWFRQIHPFCLVEIMVDSSIIGGVIIRSGRRILDHSIRSQLGTAENALTGILADA